jgi:hypothetical protein
MGRSPTGVVLAGMALTVTGVALVNIAPLRAARASAHAAAHERVRADHRDP